MGLLALPARSAMAGDWTADAIGTETGSYSSNPLLALGGAKALWGSTTSPELILKDTTPMSTVNFDTRIDENIFNQSEFNSSDFHENANLSEQNQNWQIGSQFKADYDTTRTSEITNFGFNNVVTRHLGFSASPQITYTPNAVDAVSMAGNVLTSHYDNNIFTNYNTYSLTPSYTHHFDPLNSGIFSLQAQRYQSMEGPSVRIDTVGPMIGWQTILTPRFTANGSIGAQTTHQYNGGISTGPWTWQYIFSAGLAFKGLQDTINATAARSQQPYGNGTEALQTSFAVTESHALNVLFSLNAGANYTSATYQQNTPLNFSNLAEATAGATYHATDKLDVTASYQYRHETLTSTSATANDHAVILSLVYRPNEWTLAR